MAGIKKSVTIHVENVFSEAQSYTCHIRPVQAIVQDIRKGKMGHVDFH